MKNQHQAKMLKLNCQWTNRPCQMITVLFLTVHIHLASALYSKIINCGTTNQSPISRALIEAENFSYHQHDAVGWANISTPIMIDIAFHNVSWAQDAATYTHNIGEVCYHTKPLSQRQIPDGSNVSFIRFTKPFFRNLEVLDPYDFATHAVHLNFDTSWNEYVGDYQELIQSIKSDNLLNVSFSSFLRPYQKLHATTNDPKAEIKQCRYIINRELCRTHETSQDFLGRKPSPEGDGEPCIIPLTMEMDKYKNMFLAEGYPSIEFRKRCYTEGDRLPNTVNTTDHPLYKRYGCSNGRTMGRTKPWPDYVENKFHSGGHGIIRRFAIGENALVNINLTIDMKLWNVEFYQYFVDMYRDKDVKYSCDSKPTVNFVDYNATEMIIFYYNPPVPPVIERIIPFYTFVFFIVAGIPTFTFVVALMMIISTRSMHGFNPEIWKLWLRKKKIAKREVLERRELMEIDNVKRMERMERFYEEQRENEMVISNMNAV